MRRVHDSPISSYLRFHSPGQKLGEDLRSDHSRASDTSSTGGAFAMLAKEFILCIVRYFESWILGAAVLTASSPRENSVYVERIELVLEACGTFHRQRRIFGERKLLLIIELRETAGILLRQHGHWSDVLE